MRTILLAAAAIAATASVAEAADQGFSASAGVSFFDVGEADLTALTGRLTYGFTRHVAVEGEVSLGVGDDEIGPVDVELDRALGVFVVGTLPIQDRFALFGRIGVTDVEVESGFGDSGDTGLGWGFGASYALTRQIALRGDYAQFEGDGDDADVFSVSGVLRF